MLFEQILDIPVHVSNYSSCVTLTSEWIESDRNYAHYIVQTNVSTVVNARHNPAYLHTLGSASLSVPDGMPLVWLLRAKGHKIKDRVYGPDLLLLLCEEASRKRWRCFLYGGKPGVPEQLREVLSTRFPGIQVVGAYSPPFRDLTKEEDAEICAMINTTKPDIVWVGLGSPKQDIWMYEHRDKLDAAVLHGVGAAFDFLTGQVKQAPRWMMNAGLEWLFRLFQEPRRLWRRYTITNAKFIYYLVHDLFRKKAAR